MLCIAKSFCVSSDAGRVRDRPAARAEFQRRG